MQLEDFIEYEARIIEGKKEVPLNKGQHRSLLKLLLELQEKKEKELEAKRKKRRTGVN